VEARRWRRGAFTLAAAALAAGGCGGGSSGAAKGTGGVPTSQAAGTGGGPGVWSEVAAPPEAAGFQASDAVALGADDLLFAGVVTGPSGGEARFLRWDQGSWTMELSFAVDAAARLASVAGTGTTDLWAVAGDQVYHRDDQGWSPFDSSWRSQITVHGTRPVELTRVRAAALGDVWVTETGNILHNTAAAGWTAYNFDDPTYPSATGSIAFFYAAIWIDAPNSVFVSGGSDEVGNTMDPAFLHHFDGAVWTHDALARFDIPALWRSGPSLWLAAPGQVFGTTEETLARFDGAPPATFISITGATAAEPPRLTALWGLPGTDLWAAGNNVARYDGTTWSLVTDAPAPALNFQDDRNTFVTGDPRAVWLATPGARFFRNAQ